MTFITDLFNPTFLMFLGIFVLVILLIVVYFESKMREQNHKIASMLSLVSSLAEELNGVKFGLNHLSMRGGTSFFPEKHLAQNVFSNSENKLIEVSDDESEEDDSDDELEELDDESDMEDSDDENIVFTLIEKIQNDNDIDNDIDNDNDNDNDIDMGVKVFKVGDDEEEMVDLDMEEFDDNISLSSKNSTPSIKHLNEIFASPQFENEENIEDIHAISQEDLKTIHIHLEEQQEVLDYKKLSLNKLRSVVAEKGLSLEANKLKKNELLKLLGVE